MLSDLLIPLGVGSLLVAALLAFALYVWSWYRHVAGCELRVRLGQAPCAPAAA